jgi:hypothetical protein
MKLQPFNGVGVRPYNSLRFDNPSGPQAGVDAQKAQQTLPAMRFGAGYFLYYWVSKPLPLVNLMDSVSAMVRAKWLKTIDDGYYANLSNDGFTQMPGRYIKLWASNIYDDWSTNVKRIQQDIIKLQPLCRKLGLRFSHVEYSHQKIPRYRWEEDLETLSSST